MWLLSQWRTRKNLGWNLTYSLIYKRICLLAYKANSPLIDGIVMLEAWIVRIAFHRRTSGPVVCFHYNSHISSSYWLSQQTIPCSSHARHWWFTRTAMSYILVWPLCGSKGLLHMCGRYFDVRSMGFDLFVSCNKLLLEQIQPLRWFPSRVQRSGWTKRVDYCAEE